MQESPDLLIDCATLTGAGVCTHALRAKRPRTHTARAAHTRPHMHTDRWAAHRRVALGSLGAGSVGVAFGRAASDGAGLSWRWALLALSWASPPCAAPDGAGLSWRWALFAFSWASPPWAAPDGAGLSLRSLRSLGPYGVGWRWALFALPCAALACTHARTGGALPTHALSVPRTHWWPLYPPRSRLYPARTGGAGVCWAQRSSLSFVPLQGRERRQRQKAGAHSRRTQAHTQGTGRR